MSDWKDERDAAAEAFWSNLNKGIPVSMHATGIYKVGADFGHEYGKREALTSAVVRELVEACSFINAAYSMAAPVNEVEFAHNMTSAASVANAALTAYQQAIDSDGEGK